jgi:large subunit ribosomal protein L9
MDVILLQRVAKLGQMGEVVKVRPGFARNFLIPQKKAVRATDSNRQLFEADRAQLEAVNLERRSEAETVAQRLDGMKVVLVRQAGESGQLYGSVNARDVAAAVTDAGVTIERQQVELPRPIKMLGLHAVSVSLHPEVVVGITVNVARSPEEAELQATRGRAMIGSQEEEEEEILDVDEQIESLFEAEAAEHAREELHADETDAAAGDDEADGEPARKG